MSRIVAMLPVRNEADRWLVPVMEQLSQIADLIVVYDDASTDASGDICRSYAKVRYHRGEKPWFEKNESELRRYLWDLTVLQEPDWILALDADECLDEAAVEQIPWLVDQCDYDAIAFRLFDCWKSPDHVRVDGSWNPWNRFSPLLVRYEPEIEPTWRMQPIHCGRFPAAYRDRVTFYSCLRVRHYGWARSEEHLQKYLFYRERDLAVFGSVQPHTESVLAGTVTLEPWIDLPLPTGLLGSKERN